MTIKTLKPALLGICLFVVGCHPQNVVKIYYRVGQSFQHYDLGPFPCNTLASADVIYAGQNSAVSAFEIDSIVNNDAEATNFTFDTYNVYRDGDTLDRVFDISQAWGKGQSTDLSTFQTCSGITWPVQLLSVPQNTIYRRGSVVKNNCVFFMDLPSSAMYTVPNTTTKTTGLIPLFYINRINNGPTIFMIADTNHIPQYLPNTQDKILVDALQ